MVVVFRQALRPEVERQRAAARSPNLAAAKAVAVLLRTMRFLPDESMMARFPGIPWRPILKSGAKLDEVKKSANQSTYFCRPSSSSAAFESPQRRRATARSSDRNSFRAAAIRFPTSYTLSENRFASDA